MTSLEQEEEYLFDRFYDELGEETNTKIILKESPKVKTINRKSVFVNFKMFVSALRTSESILKKFIEKEFGCSSSIDSKGMLILDKTIRESYFMNAISTFIKNYIKCPQCKDKNTEIIKENRLYYIKCYKCLSKSYIDFKL